MREHISSKSHTPLRLARLTRIKWTIRKSMLVCAVVIIVAVLVIVIQPTIDGPVYDPIPRLLAWL